MITNDQTLASYDHNVEQYVKGSPNVVHEPVAKWLTQATAKLKKNDIILEIGSGHGKDAKYLISQGYKVECTDGSQGFVDFLRTLGLSAEKLNILKDDIQGKYPLIIANMVFLHFNTDEFIMASQKVINALTDSGTLALCVKEGSGEAEMTQKIANPRYFRFWQEEEIKKTLQDVGFNSVSTNCVPDDRHGKPNMLFVIAQKESA